MKSEIKNCQNCKKDFTIEPDDFNFYEKIKVPPPTWCPKCRLIRRLMWRNMRSLYKRECDLCHKNLISFYPPDGCPVYCVECFSGDGWDQYKYAQSFDSSLTFLSQVNEILKVQPRVYQFRLGAVTNSDYGNGIINCKNSYMCFSSLDNEDVMYSESIDRCRNVVDSFSVADMEQSYWNIFSTKNYNSHYMLSSSTCIDSYFLYDCINCQNCCLSSNLRNQQYVFRNKKLSKEEYEKAVAELHLETYSGFQKAKEEFGVMYRDSMHRYAHIVSSQNVTGDLISNSKNIFRSFEVTESSENIRYCMRLIKGKDLVDCCYCLTGELSYECMSPSNNSFNQLFSMYSYSSKNMQYSIFCKNSSDCFGCVGLNNAQYCILNKQYSKEEYFEKVEEIKKHMNINPFVDSKGRIYTYGEFFPLEFCHFGYNETLALDAFPVGKEEAIRMGYKWTDREVRNYPGLVPSQTLPNSIHEVGDDILEKAISCPNEGKQEFQCTTAFKIIPDELRFYREKKLPLPRYCPNCRHYERLKYRNPMILWRRECMCDKKHTTHGEKCDVEFETTFAPDRVEKIYCEKCYQQEVY